MSDFFNDDLRTRYKRSLDAVTSYLGKRLNIRDLNMSEDFERDGVIIRTPRGMKPDVRVFISSEFLEDFNLDEIRAKLDGYRVAEKIRSLPPTVTLFVTTEGTFSEATPSNFR